METLQSLLKEITYNSKQHDHILIKETAVEAKLKSVILLLQHGDWFSFNPDDGRGKPAVMSPLLATGKSHDHHRACDCVVILNDNGELTVIYIDLKSSKRANYTGQFKSTRQFVRYVLGLLEEFHQKKLTIAHEHYVILHNAPLNKTPTIIHHRSKNTHKSRPDAAHKLQVRDKERLYLKQLLV